VNTDKLEGALSAIQTVLDRGWTVEESMEQITLESPETTDRDRVLRELQSLSRYVDAAHAHVGFGSDGFDLVMAGNDFVVSNTTAIDFSTSFEPKAVSAARSVWNGDVGRLAELPISTNRARASIRLSELVDDETRDWTVLLKLESLDEYLSATPFWTWRTFFSSERTRVVLVNDLGASFLRTESVLICSPTYDWAAAVSLLELEEPPYLFERDLSRAPDPNLVAPRSWHGEEISPLRMRLASAASALSWAAFGTRTEVSDDDSQLDVEMFGFQRAVFRISRDGLSEATTSSSDSLELFNWAARDHLVDHLLAVRQISTLRVDRPPWLSTRDVIDAAKPVLVALRSDAVSDVMRARRELEALISNIAVRSAEASASLARSAVERTVALLLAIAGVFVAQSLKAIPEQLSETLRVLVAIVLIALAIWNVFVEGPFASLPLRNLRSDVERMAPLLSDAERLGVTQSRTVGRTSNRAILVRVAVPVVYIAAALAAVVVRP